MAGDLLIAFLGPPAGFLLGDLAGELVLAEGASAERSSRSSVKAFFIWIDLLISLSADASSEYAAVLASESGTLASARLQKERAAAGSAMVLWHMRWCRQSAVSRFAASREGTARWERWGESRPRRKHARVLSLPRGEERVASSPERTDGGVVEGVSKVLHWLWVVWCFGKAG